MEQKVKYRIVYGVCGRYGGLVWTVQRKGLLGWGTIDWQKTEGAAVAELQKLTKTARLFDQFGQELR